MFKFSHENEIKKKRVQNLHGVSLINWSINVAKCRHEWNSILELFFGRICSCRIDIIYESIGGDESDGNMMQIWKFPYVFVQLFEINFIIMIHDLYISKESRNRSVKMILFVVKYSATISRFDSNLISRSRFPLFIISTDLPEYSVLMLALAMPKNVNEWDFFSWISEKHHTQSLPKCLKYEAHLFPQVIKTRLQLQGELAKQGANVKIYRGVLHAFYQVGKHDGIVALQKGLIPSLGFQFILNFFRYISSIDLNFST